MSLLASAVMDRASVLLNDVALDLYPYSIQLPYLQMANDEFSDELVDSGISLQKKTASTLTIAAGVLTYSPLPTDFLVPENCWERPTNQTNIDFIKMKRVEWIPKEQQLVDYLEYWAYQNSSILFLGATQSIDVKLEYVRILSAITTSGSSIEMSTMADNFLAHMTASHCARYIGNNKDVADDLRGIAYKHLNKILSINVKQNQAMPIQRKPFRLRTQGRFR